MKSMNGSTARKLFARVLESVVRENEPVVIVRYRAPIAAIVPLNRLTAAERAAAASPQKSRGHARRR
jgi:PHD/YefM family antitoxin component YafN of YafNO toxin-antitoxin module